MILKITKHLCESCQQLQRTLSPVKASSQNIHSCAVLCARPHLHRKENIPQESYKKQQKVLCARPHLHRKENIPQESYKKQQKAVLIRCKRSEYDHYDGQTYGKFDTIPLASKGWNHRKSRGDFFILEKYRENPATTRTTEEKCSFADTGLNEDILKVLEEKHSITEPTTIQVEGIPKILRGRNTLLTAQTGCGKTLAYLLPLIHQILCWKKQMEERPFNSPLGVVILPNRELAHQIGDVAETFSDVLPFSTSVLIGGRTKRKILNPTYENMDLLIATLGALSKLTTTGIYRMNNVHHVVLDEADTLLDDSFNEKLCHFLKRFPFQYSGPQTPNELPTGVQMTMVSATMPTSLPDILGNVIAMDSLTRVTCGEVHRILPHVPQKFVRISRSEKPAQLLSIVKHDVARKTPVMIFSNKSPTCDWISLFLNENNIPCVNLNGGVPREIRLEMLRRFQEGEVNAISCTDISSRGINTLRAKHVVNYDFPMYMADYIHRCGRTGRVGSSEECHVTNFVAGPREVELVQKIELAARTSDALPNVNANITRTIQFRAMKKKLQGKE